MIYGDRSPDGVHLQRQDCFHGWEAYKLDSIDGSVRAAMHASYAAMGAPLENRHRNRSHHRESSRNGLAL